MSDILVHDRRTRSGNDTYRISFTVSADVDKELWFEIPIEYKDWVTDSYDAAVVGLLLPAMVAGRNIQVDGSMSPLLAWFLARTVMPILSAVNKSARPIEIGGFSPTIGSRRQASAVAMGLSNGIDSMTAVHDYGPGGSAPAELRITHLLFNEVGAAGRYEARGTAQLSQLRYQNVISSAEHLRLPLIKVSSNIDDHQGDLTHGKTHILKNLTTPLLLQQGVGTFLYAADLQWFDMKVDTDNMSHTDPMLIPGFSTEQTAMRSVGCEYSRMEKTLRMTENALAKRVLNVCVRSFPNCSSCKKCMNAMATSDANGALDEFSQVFDLKTYQKFKIRYLAWLRVSRKNSFHDGARLCRPQGLKEAATYHSLVLLQKSDRLLQKLIPGYRRVAQRGLLRRVRRRLLYSL